MTARGMPRYLQGLREMALRRHAEDHALAHRSLPTGQVRLSYGINCNGEINWFDVDFDSLAAKVASACAPLSLPPTYQLPRHQRESFFEQKIEALVAAFDDRFVVERGSDRSGDRIWLRYFLQDYVTDYEHLPHGKLRIEPSIIPLSFTWYDMGVVDFEALRQAAGVADEPLRERAYSRAGTSP
jgi:hypothetical protein